jgi:nucleoside-diphosphate-sugar epimerase
MAAPLAGHLTVNLATGTSRTVLELLETLCRIAGQPCAPEFGPPRAGDVRHSVAAVDRARERLGFTAGCDFADGLRQTFDWYRRIPSR